MNIAYHTGLHLGDNSLPTWVEEPYADVLVLTGGVYSNQQTKDQLLKLISKWSKVFLVPSVDEYPLLDSQDNLTVLNREFVIYNGVRFIGATLWPHPPTILDPEYLKIKGFNKHDQRFSSGQDRDFIRSQTNLYADATVVITAYSPSKLNSTIGSNLDYVLEEGPNLTWICGGDTTKTLYLGKSTLLTNYYGFKRYGDFNAYHKKDSVCIV